MARMQWRESSCRQSVALKWLQLRRTRLRDDGMDAEEPGFPITYGCLKEINEG